MATPEEQVVHYARVWYETEKSAMCAPVGKKNKADQEHETAKRNLRKYVCHLRGAGHEGDSSDTDPS